MSKERMIMAVTNQVCLRRRFSLVAVVVVLVVTFLPRRSLVLAWCHHHYNVPLALSCRRDCYQKRQGGGTYLYFVFSQQQKSILSWQRPDRSNSCSSSSSSLQQQPTCSGESSDDNSLSTNSSSSLSSSFATLSAATTTTTSTIDTTAAAAARERFHYDMGRVIESRRARFQQNYPDRYQRRARPVVLEHDDNGAERTLTMLQHLVAIGAATQESFQIVLRAMVERGRLRWYSSTSSGSTSGGSGTSGSGSSNVEPITTAPPRIAAENNNKIIICAADQLERLLNDLSQLIKPSSISLETYNLVLQGYAICSTPRGDRQYAQRAHELLKRMQAIYGHQNDNDLLLQSQQHVLHAYAWQQANLAHDDYCARQAQQLLEQIEASSRNADPGRLMQCYAWTLEAWSKSGSPGSAAKADELFRRMKELNQTLTATNDAAGEATSSSSSSIIYHPRLDAETYSNAILAWTKATDEPASLAATKSHELLLELVDQYQAGAFPAGSEPPLIAFNGVITAWGRLGRPEQAEQVLKLMERVHQQCQSLEPDAVSYNSVLHAYLTRAPNSAQALKKVMALVEYMEETFQDRPKARPNTFTYFTLLKCWIQSRLPNHAEHAELALCNMERLWNEGDREVPPNNGIYNMVMNAYAKSNHPECREKALELLKRIKTSQYGLVPDQVSYTSVLECLAKSSVSSLTAPQEAEALLDEAFALYNQTGDPAHMPNARTFTMVILTLAKNHGSVRKARDLLTQLVQLYEQTGDPQLRPNEYAYNYVLNCAANTISPVTDLDNSAAAEAFRIATATYQEMRKSKLVYPDSYTYAFWLKCCNNLLPAGSELRAKCIAYAFEECKKAGLVTQELLTRLFQGSPPRLVQEVLEWKDTKLHLRRKSTQLSYRDITVQDLPSSWSRNGSK